MGTFIEHFRRTQKFDALLGGAEEVLGDLGKRQQPLEKERTTRADPLLARIRRSPPGLAQDEEPQGRALSQGCVNDLCVLCSNVLGRMDGLLWFCCVSELCSSLV